MSEITRFPREKKHVPEDGRCLVVHEKRIDECKHKGTYLVDESESEVTCGECKAKLNPMWVLSRLAMEENQFKRMREAFILEREELNKRRRTKCRHCHQMTEISRS